jgi:putative aldouronate transport system substrate-binding protein
MPSPADTSREVNLVYYLWGGEGTANPDILRAINTKLKADINATLEVKYIDWSDVATRYPLLFASGEPFDMSHVSPSAAAPYFTLAAQGALADLTDRVGAAAPVLKAAIPQRDWDMTMYNKRIYGVPSLYTGFNMYGYVYRRDLQEKYNLQPVASLETWEAYMDAIVKNERFAPLNGNSIDANNLYRLFVANTGQWYDAPGIAFNQMYLVTPSAQNFREVIHPAFTQEFMDWALRMHEWNAKGYWPRDILSATISAKDHFHNGNSGGYISHQPDWTGSYGTVREKLPGVETDFFCIAEINNKLVRTPAVQDTTGISATSRNVDRALMAIEKFMTDQSYYELIQYGIKGRQYDVVNGLAVQPAGYNQDRDGGGFAVWALRNDKFNIPYASEDPRRYTLNDAWNKVSADDPYVGFAFDPSRISTEIAAVSSVNSQLGIQIMLGKTNDPRAAVTQYRNQLTQAGIERLIAEVKNQLAGFTPPGK